MRIACPTCSAEYDVPDSLVTAGRLVRCARCGSEWMPVQAQAVEPEPALAPEAELPPPPVADAPPAAEAEAIPAEVAPAQPQSAMDRLSMPSVRPSSGLRLRLAWIASLAVLVVLGWAAYGWRAEIVGAWPPSARIFGVQPRAGQAP
jgi:predicted Zn finger-like uncharacterized protein